ncbi:sensor domain-containing diguanylate cyclase [Lacticaseibacillus hulanensis]|uniref:sensor domain-containing diguanylate cyclase n=1 Tax=Lacticaseibacillus hulanensis TaxID=2493111 RepID=UPI000FD71801|nr:diguanylate cyclase [Lacticaseibacillus hulanensis]
MLNWGLWFIHVFVSTLFIAGYLTVYGRYWRYIFFGNLAGTRQQINAWGLVFMPLILASLLMAAAYVDPMNRAMYMNLTLFVVAYPLITEKVALGQYTFICLIFSGFWFRYHADSWPLIAASFVFLVLVFAVNWLNHPKSRYTWWLNGLLALALSSGFWLTQSNQPVAIAWSGFVTFMLMNTFAFIYWSNVHQNDLEHKRLEDKANYDALTSTKSYALFRTDLGNAFAAARESGEALTLVMLDIDNFKAINDRYSHMAGNAILVGVATLMDKVLTARSGLHRQIYRTGGEEFNVVFPKQTPGEIFAEVDALWRAIRNAHFDYEGKQIHVTVSVGVTEMRPSDMNIDDLYKRVDENLYYSKRSGRDAITIEGVTRRNGGRQVDMIPYAFYTQPIIDIATGKVQRNELLARTYNRVDQTWTTADDFAMTEQSLTDMIQRTLAQLPIQSMNVNLPWRQFADKRVQEELCRFSVTNFDEHELTLEIASCSDVAALRDCVAEYHAAKIRVALDLHSGLPMRGALAEVVDAVDICKLSIANLQAIAGATNAWREVAEWQKLVEEHGKYFSLTDVNSEEDVKKAAKMGIRYLQGDYFSQPSLPEVS